MKDFTCDPLALTTAINTLAVAVANRIPNDAELSLLAVALTQLGDTLGTIAAQRALCKREET